MFRTGIEGVRIDIAEHRTVAEAFGNHGHDREREHRKDYFAALVQVQGL